MRETLGREIGDKIEVLTWFDEIFRLRSGVTQQHVYHVMKWGRYFEQQGRDWRESLTPETNYRSWALSLKMLCSHENKFMNRATNISREDIGNQITRSESSPFMQVAGTEETP